MNIHSLLRQCRLQGKSPTFQERGDNPLVRQSGCFERANTFIRSFYAVNLFLCVVKLSQWPLISSLPERREFRPLWCTEWLRLVDFESTVVMLLLANVVAAFAVLIRPALIIRCLAAAAMLETCAIKYSFGKIGHGEHMWIWVLIGLCFLPARFESEHTRKDRQRVLDVVWGIQLCILLFYSMSGLTKIIAIPVQLMEGQPTTFALDAMARHVADVMISAGNTQLLGNYMVSHLWLSTPIFWLALYVEVLSFSVAFRYHLHRWWAFALIGMHVGIGLTMDIWFMENMLLLGLLFVNSPFVPSRTGLWAALNEVPGARLIAGWRLAVHTGSNQST